MNITYLIPGSGGSFYCGNCQRDMLYLQSVKKHPGFSTTAIPLYLLPDEVNTGDGFESEVFFGAVSMFLREKVSFLQHMPLFMDKLLDSTPMLRIAARQAGATRTEGFEETTLNMIRGDEKIHGREVERLARYLKQNTKPDLIHISNALIIGLSRQLKEMLDIPVVCSIENEDDWIDVMVEPYRTMAWKLIGEEAVHVDAFVSPSAYFKDFFVKRTGISGEMVSVVPSGIPAGSSVYRKRDNLIPALGYFSRLNLNNGFDKLVDAFLLLKSKKETPDFEMHLCGGYTGDDKPFVKEQFRKIRMRGLNEKVKFYSEFHGAAKAEFFNNIDIMSVPVRKYDASGLYLLEANAAGVPVVQPATGAFPEILKATGGGLTYLPDNAEELSESILQLLNNSALREEMGMRGKKGVEDNLSMGKMADGIIKVYKKVTVKNP
jgi:glycosyltransferase involved in cell wall biosynthesis